VEDKMNAERAASVELFANIQAEIAAEVDEIVAFAENSPEPEGAALWEHIYVNPIGDRRAEA
jgi:TPP-dependent pyruvate/acetoin dehydrogenase alpha subunit